MSNLFYTFVLYGFLLLACMESQATNYVWIGGGPDGNWNTAVNWDPVGVPGNGDQVSISGGGPSLVGNTSVGSVLMSDQGGIYRPFGSTFSLTINDGLTYSGGGFAVDLILGIGCATNINGGGSLGFGGITVVNYGDIYCNVHLQLYYSILKNYGNFYCSGPYSVQLISNPGNIENYGVFKIPAIMGGTFTVNAFLENKSSGSIVIESGTLLCNAGTLKNEGSISIENGTILRTNGPTFMAGSTISGSGTWMIEGNPCTLEVPISNDVSTTIFNAQSIVGNGGELIILHDFNWESGIFQVPTTLASTGHLTASTANAKSLFNNFTANLVFVNEGVIDLNSAISISGTLQNNGQVNVNNAAGIYSNGTIENAGTFRKMAASSNMTLEPNFINESTGVFEQQSAETILEGYLENHGEVLIYSGATLVLNAIYGNQIVGDGNFSGPGTLVAYGYLDINVDLSLEVEHFLVNGYGLRGTGILGIANNMTWESGILLCQVDVNGGTIEISPGDFVPKQIAVGLTNNGTIISHDNFIVGPEHFSLPFVTVQNNGTFELAGGNYATLYYLFENQFVNAGLFKKTAAGYFDFDLNFVNQSGGTLRIETEELRIKNLVNEGNLEVLSGATLTISEGSHNGGNLTGGGLLKIIDLGFVLFQSLSFTTNSLYLDANLSGAGPLMVSTTMDWEDGELGIPTTIHSGGNLNFLPFGFDRAILADLTNYGSIHYASYTDCSGNIINNGEFIVENSGSLYLQAAVNLTNNGQLRVENGNYLNCGLPFVNSANGEVFITNGTLRLESGLSNAGEIDLPSGSSLEICGNSDLGNPATTILNGTVNICGSLTLNGGLDFTGDNFILSYGANIVGNGTLTIHSNMAWEYGDIEVPVNVLGNAILSIGESGGGGGGNFSEDGDGRSFGIGALRDDLTNAGTVFIYQDFELDGSIFTNNGIVFPSYATVGTSTSGSFVNNSTLNLEGGIFFDAVDFINTGTISGNGDFAASPVPINTGMISPGNSPGQISFNGDFFPGSNLVIEILDNGGPGYGHDFIYVDGAANLSGALTVQELANAPDGEYVLLEANGGISGNFDPVTLPNFYAIAITSNQVKLTKNSILPVELVDFQAVYENEHKYARLQWKTKSETNNLGYFIEKRSSENAVWVEIGFVDGKLSSSYENSYEYIDNKFDGPETTIYYRLRQEDLGGKTSYSPVRSVEISNPTLGLKVSPNPFNAFLKIGLSETEGPVQLRIFDSMGQLVFTKDIPLAAGVIDLQTNELVSGSYWIEVQTQKGVSIQKIVKNQP